MKTIPKKILIISILALNTTAYATSQDGGDAEKQIQADSVSPTVPNLALSVPPALVDPVSPITPVVPTAPLPYGDKAYKELFTNLDKAVSEQERINILDQFIDCYRMHVTLSLLYSHILNALQSRDINRVTFNSVNKILKDSLESGVFVKTKISPSQKIDPFFPPSPAVIFEKLCEVIVQENDAMKALAVATSRHLSFQLVNEMITCTNSQVPRLKKMNILLAGPTGCGKTASVKMLADSLGLPFYIGDASGFTRTGYVGEGAPSLVEGLLKVCQYDVLRAQRGIIFIDELDKICKKSSGSEIDITEDSVQAELLTLMEGKKCNIVQKVAPGIEVTHVVDTSNILFIGGGAFTALPPKKSDYTYSDFVKIGMKPELMGRWGRIIRFEGSNKEKLRQILDKAALSPITQAQTLLRLGYGVQLEFTSEALDRIAEVASELGTGTRGLSSIVDRVTESLIFDALPETVVTITLSALEKLLPPEEPKEPEHWKNMFI